MTVSASGVPSSPSVTFYFQYNSSGGAAVPTPTPTPAPTAVPRSAAVQIAQTLTACGIRAIWNFAHVDLPVPAGIPVENVHLLDSLMKLTYNLEETKGEDHV